MTDGKPLQALLRKYDVPGPRYTSYPTAPRFQKDIGPKEYGVGLERIGASDSLSLYVHIPFCAERCSYCGCHVIPTKKRSVVGSYLEKGLQRELCAVAERLTASPQVDSLHLGGGTPTYLTAEELGELFRAIGESFPVGDIREISVELDPRVTTLDQLDVLRSRGTSRVSLGVQDTADEVQCAIGRRQTLEETITCFERCRQIGFESINLDLVYGLPFQNLARFSQTLEDALALRPNRLAVFGYAHVPWVRSNQRSIDAESLPSSEERIELFLLALEKLTDAGYVHVGLDHFALPTDPLVTAQESGSLGRNFMGYTPFRSCQVIGLGVSSVGQVGGNYFQNEKNLSRYFAGLENDEFAVERGWISSQDDRLRRSVIHQILCDLRIDFTQFVQSHGVSFAEYFAAEHRRLRQLESDGLVELLHERLQVTPLGRFFLRNVAMPFDAYLDRNSGSASQLYSQTV